MKQIYINNNEFWYEGKTPPNPLGMGNKKHVRFYPQDKDSYDINVTKPNGDTEKITAKKEYTRYEVEKMNSTDNEYTFELVTSGPSEGSPQMIVQVS